MGTAPGIARQVRRLKLAIEKLKDNKSKDFYILLGGDLNIDRHLPNNPLARPELKALTPILEDFMTTCNMTQLNWLPTRHQAGCNSSLLDIFLSNILERISGIKNFYNTMSEHEGVMCTLMTKTPVKEVKSILLRDYKLATFDIIQPMIDSNSNLQSLFSDQDLEVISKKLVDGVKEITDAVVIKKRVQARKRRYEYWCQDLKSKRIQVAALHKESISTKKTDNIRNHKNAKNRH